jgi:NADPH:quinone reductase-like Zn-dependent oxidoreductase
VTYPGHSGLGGNAQFASRPENYWVELPENVDFETAAAGSWSFPTSRRIIVDRCKVQIGDTVMITGTSGGMGNASLQWAKLAGARVIGATRSKSKVSDLEAMGADLVVTTDDMDAAVEQIKAFTGGKGVNHYIEFTGAPALTHLPKKILALGGTVCFAAGDVNDEPIPFCVMDFTRLEMQVVGIRGSRRVDQVIYLEQLARGAITVPIAHELPLSEIREAHRLMESGTLVGKIVLKPWAD